MSHQIPDGNLEKVFAECMKLALAARAERRRGAGRSPATRPPKPARRRSRYLSVAVRDEVWRRDAGRCAFVGEAGKRCESTHQLEVHHREPLARGGPPTAANLALFCKRHNLHAARRDFGPAHIAAAIGGRRNPPGRIDPAPDLSDDFPGLAARSPPETPP